MCRAREEGECGVFSIQFPLPRPSSNSPSSGAPRPDESVGGGPRAREELLSRESLSGRSEVARAMEVARPSPPVAAAGGSTTSKALPLRGSRVVELFPSPPGTSSTVERLAWEVVWLAALA